MLNQENPLFQMPQQRLNTITTQIKRPTPEFGRPRNWAETQHLSALELQNAQRACPAIDQALLIPPSSVPW